ncbi:carcinoembryonic antigen-related cell adhesion molecule 2-like [Hoplias malabaricus]|uniref:carcinoembryonic antigen-related cell adhesion molecule 2-like n=1 Tax=Hoplias malabaricus TaxID=27720 RepID=UPI003462520D
MNSYPSFPHVTPVHSLKALELWMSSSSGDRTLKEGDSVNLTCAVNCTPSSPQFVWFKNGERLPESGSILHLLTLTVGDSGNYSCALKTDESVRSEPVQLNIGGVFSASSEWGVNYSEPICAVRGSSVSISCTYFYPGPVRELQRVRWCSNNTNTDSHCTVPPYIYDSNTSTDSDGFEFVGDKTSISLELWMSSSSGDRTLKEGDSVNLTCAVNCTPSSPQFVWFKNGERLPESEPLGKTGSDKLVVTGCLSGHREEYLSPCIIQHTYKASVFHLRNLTVGDSGNYSCALKTDESVRSEPVQLNIRGGEWGVNYSEPICAVRGSSVSISCTYSYPGSVREVQRVLWCSNKNTESHCTVPPYVYDSNSSTASGGFQFVGDKTSNCTLLIRNVQFSHSGGYRFRFITNVTNGKYTGLPGATLDVTALELWMSSSSGDRTLKEGDSVNLTCAVNCTLSSPQFVWFKNEERLPESGSILHLLTLTVGDSGNYSCVLKTDESVRSEPVQLNIGGSSSLLMFTALVIVGLVVSLTLIILAPFPK